NESFASNESLKTIDTSTNQTQEGQGSNEGLNGQTREYIDTVIQSTAAAIMCSMQQMMDQQNENQRQWNSQCMETINQRFERLEQMNFSNNDTSGN
ncbi:11834_t:CDS:1, partial [Gigaspora rosea]